LARKVDSELALRMLLGSEFQTFGATSQNTGLAVSAECDQLSLANEIK